MFKEITLSKHTRPGRHGFFYGLEFDLRFIRNGVSFEDSIKAYEKSFESLQDLIDGLHKRWGKEFQKHWQRKQLNRRWYIYSIDRHRRVRVCFRTPKDQFLASLMIQ